MEFIARIEIIGINPYVSVPSEVLQQLFDQVGREKGPIPICGKLNGAIYSQTLVRYNGDWRLYINTSMLKNSPKRVGEKIRISVEFDPSDRSLEIHPRLAQALEANPDARLIFDRLTPSLQKEIVRYIANLKTEAAVDRNIGKAIGFLLGKERFIGRDNP